MTLAVMTLPPQSRLPSSAQTAIYMTKPVYMLRTWAERYGDVFRIKMAGFGDFALDKPGEHPYYYGGNLKSSLKLTEVMKINFEQQELILRIYPDGSVPRENPFS